MILPALSLGTTLWSGAASVLGSYNLARYLSRRAIVKRRELREKRRNEADLRKAVAFGRKIYLAASDGIDDKEAAVASAVIKKLISAGKGNDVPLQDLVAALDAQPETPAK